MTVSRSPQSVSADFVAFLRGSAAFFGTATKGDCYAFPRSSQGVSGGPSNVFSGSTRRDLRGTCNKVWGEGRSRKFPKWFFKGGQIIFQVYLRPVFSFAYGEHSSSGAKDYRKVIRCSQKVARFWRMFPHLVLKGEM